MERSRTAVIEEAVRKTIERLQMSSNPRPPVYLANRNMNQEIEGTERTANTRRCFYCDEYGHMQLVCPHKAKHLRDGIIAFDQDGRLTMSDGTPLPENQQGGLCLKDRIEERYNQSVQQIMMQEILFDDSEPYAPEEDDFEWL
jgi:hypothetical protein